MLICLNIDAVENCSCGSDLKVDWNAELCLALGPGLNCMLLLAEKSSWQAVFVCLHRCDWAHGAERLSQRYHKGWYLFLWRVALGKSGNICLERQSPLKALACASRCTWDRMQLHPVMFMKACPFQLRELRESWGRAGRVQAWSRIGGFGVEMEFNTQRWDDNHGIYCHHRQYIYTV